jgi:acetylornithine/N-succinyldiaminopimelate aminotransferase
MCAAGLAVVAEVAKPAFLEGVASRGNYLAGELKKLSDKYDLAGVRGRGLLLALNLGRPIAAEIVARAFEDGLLLNAPSADALRFMPALNVSYQEIAEMIATLDRLLSTCGAGW